MKTIEQLANEVVADIQTGKYTVPNSLYHLLGAIEAREQMKIFNSLPKKKIKKP